MAGQHHGGHEESRPAPMSKDERVELILDVAERLFAQRGPEGVTVREIAAEAGISHALVHNYLGSKEELFKAVLMRDQQRILRAAEGADSLEVALPRIIAEVLGPTRSYATLVTHSAIHGMPWDAKVQGFAVRRLMELAAEQARGEELPQIAGLDYRFPVAAVIAMVLGWIAVEEWLEEASGLELDAEQVREGLIAMAQRMLGRED